MAARKVIRSSQSNNLPIGMVVYSRLTEVQFQELNGPSWVLYDDRDITGSALAAVTGVNTLEDARGLMIRAKNNTRSDGNENPGGDLALGTFQSDAMQTHSHASAQHNHDLPFGVGWDPANVFINTNGTNESSSNTFNNFRGIMGRSSNPSRGDITTDSTFGRTNDRTPGNTSFPQGNSGESRPKNLTLNAFIKINP